jgi:hypothetical protein
MWRVAVLLGAAVGFLAFASSAVAGTTVPVSMTLTEPLIAGAPGSSPCPDIHIAFNCGSGEVIPFGHATEEVAIGVCGDTCNIREIDLSQGSILLQETVTDFSCPGACGSEFPHGAPFSATLADVVIDATGIFEGATGTLGGTLNATVWHGQIRLSGTITLDR